MPTVQLSSASDGVTVLTLDRPERLNALSFEMVVDLHDALDHVNADHSCRVLVITGAGRGFCSGLDLKTTGSSPRSAGVTGPRAGLAAQAHIADLVPHIRALEQPVIAAVNGPAFGGGFAIACACDIRLASDSARFCTQFIKVGVGGCDIGISYTLPRLIGASRAFDLMLTGREIDATEAERIGLVSSVVAGGAVLPAAVALAESICAHSPFSVVMTKEVMWANLDAPNVDAAIHLENRTQILAGTTGDMAEAARAFAERRKPVWRS